MLLIYLLSVVLNALVGLILSFCQEEAEPGALSLSLNNETVRLIIGALSFLTGILKILSPVRAPGNIPVLGDLLPALVGLAGGFILLFEFYRRKAPDSSVFDFLERVAALIERNRKISGYICIAVAALHAIFYQVIFL